MTVDDRRQIEDYLPLDVLNAIASKEKKHPRRYVELGPLLASAPPDHRVPGRHLRGTGVGTAHRCRT